MAWNTEEFRAYYNATLHVNIKIMTSQQMWYLLLNYFNNKINFLFSCEIRSWSLRFHQFDACQVNTAQSNTLVHSIVTNKWAKFGEKNIQAIFVLGYFILPHPADWHITLSQITENALCIVSATEGDMLCGSRQKVQAVYGT